MVIRCDWCGKEISVKVSEVLDEVYLLCRDCWEEIKMQKYKEEMRG